MALAMTDRLSALRRQVSVYRTLVIKHVMSLAYVLQGTGTVSDYKVAEATFSSGGQSAAGASEEISQVLMSVRVVSCLSTHLVHVYTCIAIRTCGVGYTYESF